MRPAVRGKSDTMNDSTQLVGCAMLNATAVRTALRNYFDLRVFSPKDGVASLEEWASQDGKKRKLVILEETITSLPDVMAVVPNVVVTGPATVLDRHGIPIIDATFSGEKWGELALTPDDLRAAFSTDATQWARSPSDIDTEGNATQKTETEEIGTTDTVGVQPSYQGFGTDDKETCNGCTRLVQCMSESPDVTYAGPRCENYELSEKAAHVSKQTTKYLNVLNSKSVCGVKFHADRIAKSISDDKAKGRLMGQLMQRLGQVQDYQPGTKTYRELVRELRAAGVKDSFVKAFDKLCRGSEAPVLFRAWSDVLEGEDANLVATRFGLDLQDVVTMLYNVPVSAPYNSKPLASQLAATKKPKAKKRAVRRKTKTLNKEKNAEPVLPKAAQESVPKKRRPGPVRRQVRGPVRRKVRAKS